MPNGGNIANQTIASRRQFNQLSAHLRAQIIRVYNESEAVINLIKRSDLTKGLLEDCLKRIKACGRLMVETIIAIRQMTANTNALNQIWAQFFGYMGPAVQIFQRAGINPTVAIAGMLRILPRYQAGCNRELARLKGIATNIQAILKYL